MKSFRFCGRPLLPDHPCGIRIGKGSTGRTTDFFFGSTDGRVHTQSPAGVCRNRVLALRARRCAVASRLFVLCVLQPSALRAAAARVRCHGMPWAGVGACPAAEWKGYGGDRSPRAQDSKLGANLAFASLYRSCGFLGRLRYQMICGVGSDRVLWSGSCWAAEKRGHERTAPCGSQGDHGVSAMRIPWLSIRRRECRRWSRNGAHFGAGQLFTGGARL